MAAPKSPGERLATPIFQLEPGAVIQQPTASGRTEVRYPAGPTYRRMLLFFRKAAGAIPTRAELAAGIAEIKVVVSGEEVISPLTGAQAIALAEFYSGQDTSAQGVLELNWERVWDRNPAEGRGAMLGTADQTQVQVLIQYAGGSVLVALDAYSVIHPEPQKAGVIAGVRLFQVPAGAAGTSTFRDLPARGDNETLAALHLFPPTVADLTNVRYKADNVPVIDGDPRALDVYYQQSWPYRRPQRANGMVSLDFSAGGFIAEGVDMNKVAGHVLDLTFSAGYATFPGLYEVARPLASRI